MTFWSFFCVSIIFHCILMVVPFLDCSVNIQFANRGYTERKGSGYCIPTFMAKTCVINLQFTKVHPSFIGSRVQRITLQILYDILTYPQPIHQGLTMSPVWSYSFFAAIAGLQTRSWRSHSEPRSTTQAPAAAASE